MTNHEIDDLIDTACAKRGIPEQAMGSVKSMRIAFLAGLERAERECKIGLVHPHAANNAASYRAFDDGVNYCAAAIHNLMEE